MTDRQSSFRKPQPPRSRQRFIIAQLAGAFVFAPVWVATTHLFKTTGRPLTAEGVFAAVIGSLLTQILIMVAAGRIDPMRGLIYSAPACNTVMLSGSFTHTLLIATLVGVIMGLMLRAFDAVWDRLDQGPKPKPSPPPRPTGGVWDADLDG